LKTAIFAITREGQLLAERLSEKVPDSTVIRCRGNTRDALRRAWDYFDALVCIMACGIVVRAVAPLIEDKKTDPAVLVIDQKGRYVIPVLSGHFGGANELALKIAAITGGKAAITTASDVSGNTALDIWIRDNRLRVENAESLPEIMGRLVDKGRLTVFSDLCLPVLPPDLVPVDSLEQADMAISIKIGPPSGFEKDTLFLHPSVLIAGIGCNRGTAADKISDALEKTCIQAGLSPLSICRIASIDLKGDEAGLLEFARQAQAELCLYSAEELNRVEGTGHSDAVFRATGAKGVCQPAAILGAGGGPLLVEKQKWKDVTIALAGAGWPWWEQAPDQ